MKLFLNETSPYARLVRIVVIEKNLARAVELCWTDPWASPPELLAVNPFSKVPVLVSGDGVPLTGSAVICEFLNRQGDGPDLFPAHGIESFNAQRKHGLGRGLIDVAFGVTIERRFATANGPSQLAPRWLESVRRGIAHLESNRPLLAARNEIDIGDLALAVALGYVDFRLKEVEWRNQAPAVAQWYEKMAARRSLQETAPRP